LSGLRASLGNAIYLGDTLEEILAGRLRHNISSSRSFAFKRLKEDGFKFPGSASGRSLVIEAHAGFLEKAYGTIPIGEPVVWMKGEPLTAWDFLARFHDFTGPKGQFKPGREFDTIYLVACRTAEIGPRGRSFMRELEREMKGRGLHGTI